MTIFAFLHLQVLYKTWVEFPIGAQVLYKTRNRSYSREDLCPWSCSVAQALHTSHRFSFEELVETGVSAHRSYTKHRCSGPAGPLVLYRTQKVTNAQVLYTGGARYGRLTEAIKKIYGK